MGSITQSDSPLLPFAPAVCLTDDEYGGLQEEQQEEGSGAMSVSSAAAANRLAISSTKGWRLALKAVAKGTAPRGDITFAFLMRLARSLLQVRGARCCTCLGCCCGGRVCRWKRGVLCCIAAGMDTCCCSHQLALLLQPLRTMMPVVAAPPALTAALPPAPQDEASASKLLNTSAQHLVWLLCCSKAKDRQHVAAQRWGVRAAHALIQHSGYEEVMPGDLELVWDGKGRQGAHAASLASLAELVHGVVDRWGWLQVLVCTWLAG
jgi:hypothetical protein